MTQEVQGVAQANAFGERQHCDTQVIEIVRDRTYPLACHMAAPSDLEQDAKFQHAFQMNGSRLR